MPLDMQQVRETIRDAAIRDYVADGVTRFDILLRDLRTRGRIRIEPGPQIRWIVLTQLPNVYNIRGFDAFETQQPEQFRSAALDWREKVVPIPLDKLTREVAQRAPSENVIIDLIAGLMDNARRAMAEKIATGLYSDGTDPKEIDGLRVAIHNSNTYAGIARSGSTTWWNSRIYENANNAEPSIMYFLQRITQLEEGDVSPTWVITTRAIYNKIKAEALTHMIADQGDETSLGWPFIRLDNRVRLSWSSFCPAGNAFILNMDHVKLTMLNDFEVDEVYPTNQMAVLFRLYWSGNLVVTNPVYQGRIFNLNES